MNTTKSGSAVAGMAARIVWLIVFLSLALEAMACPRCMLNRLLESNWHVKFFILNLVAAVGFTANRLDVVRVLYAFIPYVTLYLWMHSRMLWYAHPAMRPHDGVYGFLVTVGISALSLNLVGAGWLYVLGRLRFFRRNKEKGLALWQPFAFAASVYVANLIM